MRRPKLASGPQLYLRAKKLIPGGTQLLSKRPEMFLPDLWPSYFDRARGVNVWGLDGTKYLDMTHGSVGACVLGYADPDVNRAVAQAVRKGTMCTLNAPEEVELAELLIELHPWASKVRYARCGGESMAMAVRIARAATGRTGIALCGYHGWHDWYLAANLSRNSALDGHLLPGLSTVGVPRSLRGTVHTFRYNHAAELDAIVADHGSNLGAIVMEPVRNEISKDFLRYARKVATKIGAALIFDEVSSGFRLTNGGAHMVFGVHPDIAVLAKAMSNGFAMGAVIGTDTVMDAAQKSFISSTYWTERIGPTAALATIRKFRELKVADHLIRTGTQVQNLWKTAAKDAGIRIEIGGIPPLSHFAVVGEQAPEARTLFTQLMLDRRILAGTSFYPMYAHRTEHLDRYQTAVIQVFQIIGNAMRAGSVMQLLHGPVAHSGFRRLN